MDIWRKFIFFAKIWIFDETFDFWPKFGFLTNFWQNISIFQHVYFWQKCWFFNIFILDKRFHFTPKFRWKFGFLTTFFIFDKNSFFFLIFNQIFDIWYFPWKATIMQWTWNPIQTCFPIYFALSKILNQMIIFDSYFLPKISFLFYFHFCFPKFGFSTKSWIFENIWILVKIWILIRTSINWIIAIVHHNFNFC